MFVIRHEAPADAEAVESLLDRCFGSDRRRKISYRYRDPVPPLSELCFVAEDETGVLVGAIRYWPLLLDARPALLLGPLAIDPDRQGRGIGRGLVFHSLTTAAAAGHQLVFLVGDPAYYARFGFAVAPPDITMPDEQPLRLNYRLLHDEVRMPRRGVLRPAVFQADRYRGQGGSIEAARPEVKAIATTLGIH